MELVIEEIERSARYSCVAENNAGKSHPGTSTIHVIRPGRFIVSLMGPSQCSKSVPKFRINYQTGISIQLSVSN